MKIRYRRAKIFRQESFQLHSAELNYKTWTILIFDIGEVVRLADKFANKRTDVFALNFSN